MVGKIPYPFKTREEYEASLGKPVGKEWNCATNYVKKITPRIQVKVGSIIDPIKFTSNTKKSR
jgi:U3 small nucleolar RNA-associated protein 14